MKLVRLNAKDNILFATEPIRAGETFSLSNGELVCRDGAKQGAKIALRNIPKGAAIQRFAIPIGTALSEIQAGETVTAKTLEAVPSCNIRFHGPDHFPEIKTTHFFSGYSREDGRVGIRNDIWIIPFSEETAEFAQDLADLCDTVKFPNVGGVFSCFFPHLPERPAENIRILTALAHHPNAAGVLIPVRDEDGPLVQEFRKMSEGMDNRRIRIFACRPSENETAQGMALIHQLAMAALAFPSRDFAASELVVGILCAFPNTLSGLTANPLLGVLTDKITKQGGNVVLSCPRLRGAEEMLSYRCLDHAAFEKAQKRMIQSGAAPAFDDFATPAEEAVFYLEPGGTAPVSDVLDGHSPIFKSGLNLLAQPSDIPAAMTALAACGAQVVFAACGEDAPSCSLLPLVRIASSTDSAKHCGGRFDFLAGSLTENKTMSQVSQELWNYLLALTASREKTKNEASRHRNLHLY